MIAVLSRPVDLDDRGTGRIVRRSFETWAKRLRNKLGPQIAAALQAGEAELLTGDPAWGETWREVEGPWNRAVKEALDDAGKKEVARLRFRMQFDIENPYATEWATRHAAKRVMRVTRETKAAIRGIIADAMGSAQLPARAAGRLLRPTIGLTERGSHAVWRRAETQRDDGWSEDDVVRSAERYSARLLRQRGEVIARSEIVSASNAGTQTSWVQAQGEGFVSKSARRRWIAGGGVRTCDICRELNGQQVGLDEPFQSTALGEVVMPTAHPGCFVAGTRVTGPRVTGSVVRWYDGPLVEVETLFGRRLSVTPNHPVLTPKGWVAAGALHEGDDLVDERWPKAVGAVDPDHQHIPSRIEEVAETFGGTLGVVAVAVPVAPEDFHGDGRDSNICVVRSDRLLRNGLDAAIPQPQLEEILGRHNVRPPNLLGRGDLGAMLDGLRLSAHGVVSRHRIRPMLLGGAGGGQGAVDLGAAADLHVRLGEASADDLSAHPKRDGERELRLAGHVAAHDLCVRHRAAPGVRASGPGLFDTKTDDDRRDTKRLRNSLTRLAGEEPGDDLRIRQVVRGTPAGDAVRRVGRRGFAGHVFNLQTQGGWYTANGIVVHNCRCTMGLEP